LPSFGERLKLERVKRAITLEQISTSTKIGTRMLQALEEENFDQLPGGIFNKGFVRAYARHVGLDEDQAVADYLEASGQNTPPKPDAAIDSANVADDPGEPAPPWRTPLGWIAAGLLVVALAGTLWSRWHHDKKDPEPQSSPEATSKPAASSSPEATKSAPAPTGLISSQAAAPTKPPVNLTPAPAPTPARATTVLPATSVGEFTVVILAHEESWASIQVDDKPAVEDNLTAESQRAVHARNQAVIKVGNTGGVDFVFNGKKLPSQGDYGEVKTLTFGPGGLQPKTTAPPPTRQP
jgi:cytoskeleton protein RodZ